LLWPSLCLRLPQYGIYVTLLVLAIVWCTIVTFQGDRCFIWGWYGRTETCGYELFKESLE